MTSTFTPPAPLQTAVLFLVFNRPDTTAQVFEAIRQAKPPRLYVAADGPREGREGEAGRVAKVREIATAVDWSCEVKTLFREENLGCKYAVSGAINWFFEQEEQGVILEDDCLPHSDFFPFCESLLARYLDDLRVTTITGQNFQKGRWRGEGSYYFSKYNHCWGWATWRRAWEHYQGELPFWAEWKSSPDWFQRMPLKKERDYWTQIFDQVAAGQIDSWAYPWTGSVWFHGGLTATPNVNLISNIGFGPKSTHTAESNSPLAALPTYPLGEIIHPQPVARDSAADKFVFKSVYGGQSSTFTYRSRRFSKRILSAVRRRLANPKL